MRKTFLIAAAAVLSIVACQKEMPVAPEGNYTVRASRESASGTKSTVSDDGAFAWSAGDAIGLWNGSKFCELTTSIGGSATADFTGTMEGTAQSYAVFPFALNAKVEYGTVKVALSSSYEWKSGETNSPMLAECGENPTALTFKHLGGLVKVSVKNVPAEAAKFVLTADKDIAGEYSVSDDAEGNKIIKSAGTAENTSVAFTFTAGTATEMAFYVPVPVGDYKFAVALQKADGTQLWSYGGASVNKVKRAEFIIMPELTFTKIPGTGEGVVNPAETLQKLLNAGGSVTLDRDYTGDFSVPANVKVDLKLNGHNITNVSGDTFTVGLGGELTISGDGTVDNVSHGRSCIYNNGKVTLNGGAYTRSKETGENPTTSGKNSYYNILNHGELIINEGVTVYQSGAFSSLIDNGYYDYKKSDPRFGYVDGTNNAAPSLTINGGSFSGGINTIKNDDGATLTIIGGEFSNTTQSCVQNNNVATISGGTYNPAKGHSVESKAYAGEHNKGETSITGGTFNGPLYTYGGGTFKISGGTFNDMSALNYLTDKADVTVLAAAGTYKDVFKATAGKALVKPAVSGEEVIIGGINAQSNNSTADFTFENITFDNSIQDKGWFTGTAGNIYPCVGVWGGTYSFKNCKFIVDGGSGKETGIMTWWTVKDCPVKLSFDACSFEGKDNASEARAMQIYGHVNLDVIGCTLSTAKRYALKYVGNEGYTANIKNNNVSNCQYTVELGSSEYSGSNYTVNFEGNTLGQGIADYKVAHEEGATINGGTKKE